MRVTSCALGAQSFSSTIWRQYLLVSAVILVAALRTPAAIAQQGWTGSLYNSISGNSYTTAVYPNKAAAIAAMEQLDPADDPGNLRQSLQEQPSAVSMNAVGITYSFAGPKVPLVKSTTFYYFDVPPVQEYGFADQNSALQAMDADLGFAYQGTCPPTYSTFLPNGGPVTENVQQTTRVITGYQSYNAYTFFAISNCEQVLDSTDSGRIYSYYNLSCPAGYKTFQNPQNPNDLSCVNPFVGNVTGPVMDCPSNGGPSSQVGDPCNVSTGDFAQTETDYSAAGLSFTRYYHSANLELHGLGVGWTNNYASTLIIQTGPDGTNFSGLVRPDGHHDAYGIVQIPNFGGERVSLSGDGIQFVPLSGGNWATYKTDGSSDIYNSSGQLIQRVAASGQITALTYNSVGLLSSITGSFGQTLQLAYDSSNRLSVLTEPDGTSTITYAYDANNNLISVTYPDGSVRQYQYQDSSFPNNLTGIVDESGTQFLTVAYDPTSGKAVSSQQAGGAQAVSIAYGSGSTVVTDSLGATHTYSFTSTTGYSPRISSVTYNDLLQSYAVPSATTDVQQRVTQFTDANGNATTYAYDPVHLTSKTEASGTGVARTTSYQYLDTNSALLTLVTEPLKQTAYAYFNGTNLAQTKTVTDLVTGASRTWSYTYDSYGRVLTVQGPRTDLNSTTAYTYYTCTTGAQCGQVQTATDPVGNVTTYNTYNAHALPVTITDPNGVVTTLSYDARQRLISRSTAGETTSFAYYPTGLLQTLTLPDGSSLQYTYDGAHRLTGIKDSLGNSKQYTLDAMGNRTAISTYDPNNVLGTAQSRIYNALNQLYQVVGSAGTAAVTTTYAYDNNGNQLASNAPLSRNTSQAYDPLNRVMEVTDPNSGVTMLTYDANNNLTSVQGPLGLLTGYQYDGLGDLISQMSPATGSTTNTYDSAGNLSTSQDARGVTASYSYDASNRIIQAAYGDETIVYGYDAGTYGKGRLTSAADATQSVVWQYDALGRVVQKTQAVDNVTSSVGYAYSNGDLVTLTTPSGQLITYGYTNHQINSIAVNGTPLIFNVRYEPYGPSRGWSWGNGTSEIRTYDTDGNPSQFTGAESASYSIDSAFRIIGISNSSTPSASWTYGYDLLDRITKASTSTSSLTYSYDADGNWLSQSGMSATDAPATFTYNNRGRLTSVTASSGQMTVTYNSLGQRIAKASPVGTTVFAYDESGHLLGEYTAGGGLVEETVWMGNIPVATLQPNGSGGVNVFYVHADHLNTPKAITRPSDNSIVWRWDQDPFGTAVPNSNPSGIGAFTYNLRYPGQYYDQETGLSYNYFRDYDPTVGRYIESDPIGLKGGINTYAYARARPVTLSDPFGWCDQEQQCVQKFLRNNYGAFLADTIIPDFSLGSVFTNTQAYAISFGKSLLVKGGLVYTPQLLSTLYTTTGQNLAAYPGMAEASAGALQTGTTFGEIAAGGATVLGSVVSLLGGFSTTADLIARLSCIPDPPADDPIFAPSL